MSNGFDVRGRTLAAGELAAWLSEHSLGNRFGLVVVGTDAAYGAFDSRAVALAIVAADGEGRYIDTAALTADDEAALASWLADPGPPKAVHGVKAATHALAGCGWRLRGVTSDPALAGYLLRPGRRGFGLNELLIRHMRCALPAEAVEQPHAGPPDAQAVILRACAVLDLADVLDEELARIDSSSLLGRLELPLARVLADMEAAGVAVDREALARIGDRRGGAVSGLLESVAGDGRIHPTFLQTATGTGRLSSAEPDLHRSPVGPTVDDGVRDAFVAGDGYAELMTARYERLEARLAAHLSGDGTHDCRPAVVAGARSAGFVSTLLGRRRYLPELDSGDPQVREAAEHAALSIAIEGGAADIIGSAMINLDQAIKDGALRSRLLLQAGDELLLEVASGERDALTTMVREHLADAYPLDEPLEVSVGCGPNWGAAGP